MSNAAQQPALQEAEAMPQAAQLVQAHSVQLVQSVSRCEQEVQALVSQEAELVLGVSWRRGGPPRHEASLLTLASSSGRTLVLDVGRRPQLPLAGGVTRLLESPSVVKVCHYGLADCQDLAAGLGTAWSSVFDVGLAFDRIVVGEGLPRRRATLRGLHEAVVAVGCGAPSPLQEETETGQASWRQCPLLQEEAETGQASWRQCPLLQEEAEAGQASWRQCPLLQEETETGQACWRRRPLARRLLLQAAASAAALLPLHRRLSGACPTFADVAEFRRFDERLGHFHCRPAGVDDELRLRCRLLATCAQPLARRLPFGIFK